MIQKKIVIDTAKITYFLFINTVLVATNIIENTFNSNIYNNLILLFLIGLSILRFYNHRLLL